MNLPYQRARDAIADGYVERDMDYGDGGPTYRVHFAVTYGGCPAQTYGPPERCYPAEGPEWEITGIDAEEWDADRKPYWVRIEDVREPYEVDAVYIWAESLDLSEEAAQAGTDQQELYRESEAECRRDPLE